MTKLTTIIAALGAIATLILWFLKRYLSIDDDIQKAEEKRDNLDEELENAILAGNNDFRIELERDRHRLSKKLARLYNRRNRRNIFGR